MRLLHSAPDLVVWLDCIKEVEVEVIGDALCRMEESCPPLSRLHPRLRSWNRPISVPGGTAALTVF